MNTVSSNGEYLEPIPLGSYPEMMLCEEFISI